MSNLLKEITKTKEEFYLNDQLIFQNMNPSISKSVETMPMLQIPKNSLTPKGTTYINFPTENFMIKNSYAKPNYSFTMERKEHHHSLIEKENTSQIQTFWKVSPQVQSIYQERAKTPEKTILIKNMVPNSFLKKIPYISETKQIFDNTRHARKYSVHTPCFARRTYSPYHLNTPVLNNVKLVKY